MAEMGQHRIIFITHSEPADPGPVAEALQALGYDTEICCPFLGDSLPRLEAGRPKGYAASVVFGGAQMVGDAVEMDFLAAELDWVGEQLENGAPFFGICLGAQMMAHALGAKVWEHPDGMREIGYHEINATAAGRELFPESFTAYQWHREGFDLPEGTELLATGGEAFYNQAFRYGENAYGVQFHPEMYPKTMERWITSEAGGPQLSLPGAQMAAEQRALAPVHNPVMRRWLDGFVNAWIGPANGDRQA
ncbi:MAG: glutamine amidotransferase [Rhodospirillaceae bacterium]|nr:glutamine amidotransferase [Rhodospirillaceae bacterium]MBT4425401.1 glutamine amidotransferase [Rhodospirillaceae bacterium]MBT5781341.1 glutamine amidotransferase [Rhodospirillaceae bacterium]MBT6829476.1 glutamine amidotransferase [Rhodospirillaceae bacterium]